MAACYNIIKQGDLQYGIVFVVTRVKTTLSPESFRNANSKNLHKMKKSKLQGSV